MNKVILLIILTFTLFGFYFFQNKFLSSQDPKTKTQDLEEFTMALDWVPNTNHTGIYVALNKGWYRDEGLDVNILPYSQVSADTLVYENKADVGISSTENIVAVSAIGSPVISIAAIISTNTSGIITLEKSGIESPKDLEGKTYGGFGLAYEEAVINEIIKSDGGNSNFTNIILETAAMDALESGKIDFVWVFEGWDKIASDENDLQTNFFPIKNHGIPDYYTPNIITGQNQIMTKKSQIAKFMKATQKGYKYAISNPRESAKILIDETPEGTFPNEELVIKSQIFLSNVYADKNAPWGIQLDEMWKNYPKFMIESGAVKNNDGNAVTNLDFDSLYTNEFLYNE